MACGFGVPGCGHVTDGHDVLVGFLREARWREFRSRWQHRGGVVGEVLDLVDGEFADDGESLAVATDRAPGDSGIFVFSKPPGET